MPKTNSSRPSPSRRPPSRHTCATCTPSSARTAGPKPSSPPAPWACSHRPHTSADSPGKSSGSYEAGSQGRASDSVSRRKESDNGPSLAARTIRPRSDRPFPRPRSAPRTAAIRRTTTSARARPVRRRLDRRQRRRHAPARARPLRGRLDRGPACLGLVSFEPDKLEVHLDGTRLRLEPGQTVIPHGVDRELTPDEIASRGQA
jgi:hypothetical protein